MCINYLFIPSFIPTLFEIKYNEIKTRLRNDVDEGRQNLLGSLTPSKHHLQFKARNNEAMIPIKQNNYEKFGERNHHHYS